MPVTPSSLVTKSFLHRTAGAMLDVVGLESAEEYAVFAVELAGEG